MSELKGWEPRSTGTGTEAVTGVTAGSSLPYLPVGPSRWRTILHWVGPAIVAVLLAAGYIWGHGLWERHNAQHRQAEQDHAALLQVIAFLNQQQAARSAPVR